MNQHERVAMVVRTTIIMLALRKDGDDATT